MTLLFRKKQREMLPFTLSATGLHYIRAPGTLCITTYLEQFCLLEYNAVFSVESHPTVRRNMSSPSSGLKSKASKKPG
jgi:hypothetical protein